MISENIKKYCNGDITKIENYNEAITDTTQTWTCHHRLGIRPFSKETISHKKLIEYGLYFNQPPEALLFLPASEHHKLHIGHMSKEWHENLSNAIKNQEENSGRFQKGHQINKGRKRPDVTENQGKKVICIETNKVFDTVTDAAIYYKLYRSNISKCINGKRLTAGGFHWSLLNNEE